MIPALAVLAGVVLVVLARARWAFATVVGHSMSPTFADGERLLVHRVRRPPRPGEVIVFAFRAPGGEAVSGSPDCLVKRVVAVAGDPVPDWVAPHPRRPPRVPTGFVVVAGDNPRSQDSRQLGLIDRRTVVGVVRRG